MQGGALVVVATPIGNLADLSPRAVEALREADVVACEDTRRTATLMRHAEASTPLIASHEHNELVRAEEIVQRVAAGQTVALVSDAGTPAISDPGYRAVRAVADAGLAVTVIPGPGAVEAALVASGLPTDSYLFLGFAPTASGARRRLLGRVVAAGETVVLFENPKRLPRLLAELAASDPGRPVAVAREMTKLHEEVVRGSAGDLAERFATPPPGEVTVVVGAAAEPEPAGSEALDPGMDLLLEAGVSPARAAEIAATLGAASRNAAYRAALTAAARRSER